MVVSERDAIDSIEWIGRGPYQQSAHKQGGSELMSGALVLGRKQTQLDPDNLQGGADELYTSQRLDGKRAEALTYKHCTFANISLKSADFERCEFVDCAFLDCYFRDTTFRNCSFEGCKFEDCSFADPRFLDCSFIFPDFRRCYIPFKYFAETLPTDPGYRHSVADILAREAGAAGEAGDARRYRLKGEDAFEQHQWNLAWASGGAYYEKPRPPLDRVGAGLSWLGRKFNRHLWGYGERVLILTRSFLIVGAALFPLVFWLAVSSDLVNQDGTPLGLMDYELFSLDNLLNASGFSGVKTTGALASWIVGTEVLAGLLFIGLFISLVFNWIRRR